MPSTRLPRRLFEHCKTLGLRTALNERITTIENLWNILTSDDHQSKQKDIISLKRNNWEQNTWKQYISHSQSLKWYPKGILLQRPTWFRGQTENLNIVRLRLGNIGLREGTSIHCLLCNQENLQDPTWHVLCECATSGVVLQYFRKQLLDSHPNTGNIKDRF